MRLPSEIWSKICKFICLPDLNSFEGLEEQMKNLAMVSCVCKDSTWVVRDMFYTYELMVLARMSDAEQNLLYAVEPVFRAQKWVLKSIQKHFPTAIYSKTLSLPLSAGEQLTKSMQTDSLAVLCTASSVLLK